MMASDSRLESLIISALSRYDPRAETVTRNEEQKEGGSRQLLPQFHLVKAPPSGCKMDDTSPEWLEACQVANEAFSRPRRPGALTAHIFIGSVKVNPVVELLFATLFKTEPFKNQDSLSHPTKRRCPILFRYRNDDPQPPSCIGGLSLASKWPAEQPGIYFESANGDWVRCPWVESERDAAFLVYAHSPGLNRLDVACGGFSSRATYQFANDLETIVSQLGTPTYETDHLRVGLYVIEFFVDGSGRNSATPALAKSTAATAYEGCELKVHKIPIEVLARRLDKRPHDSSTEIESVPG
jgi:hypothetical protein